MEEAIDLFLHHLKTSGHTENTISAYGSDLRQFYAYLRRAFPAAQDWQDVGNAQIAAYCIHLHELGRTPSTIARKNVALRRFLAFGGRELPAPQRIPAPSPPANAQPTRPSPLNPSEIARLLAQPARSTSATARRNRAMLALLYATDVQASEVVELNLADVGAEAGTIVCGAGGKRTRRVSLDPRAAALLADYLAHERNAHLTGAASSPALEEPLFRNQRGRRLTRQGVWQIVRTCAAAAGIENPVTPRILRRLSRANWTETSAYDPDASFLLLDGIAVLPEQLNPPNPLANQ